MDEIMKKHIYKNAEILKRNLEKKSAKSIEYV